MEPPEAARPAARPDVEKGRAHPRTPRLPVRVPRRERRQTGSFRRPRPRSSSASGRCSPSVTASSDGHQIFWPMSSTSAGTSTDRTRNVSSSTPNATTNPIWVRNTSGSTPSTENVPASTIPADVITAAGHREAADHARPRAVALRLLAHARHQEDVVVDAQRDQEHERVQRQRRVRAGEAEDHVVDDDADAERGAEATGSPSRSAAAARARRAAAPSGSGTRSAARSGRSAACRASPPRGRRAGSRSGRRPATSSPPASRAAARIGSIASSAGSSTGRRSSVACEQHAAARPRSAGRTAATLSTSPTAAATASRLRRVGHDDVGRDRVALRERLGEQLLALDRLDLADVAVAAVRPVEKFRIAEAADDQDRGGRDPDPPRGAGDALADPAPDAVRLVGALVADVRDAVVPAEDRGRQNARRPMIASSAGRKREHREHRHGDAHRADRAQAGGGVDLGDRQRQQRARSPSGRRRRSPGPAVRSASASPRACRRAGAAPRGSARRAAARSRCPRRARARRGSRRTGR